MRRIRWVDLLLIAAIVPLGVWAWATARERSRLEATHARLRERLGHFDVTDRTRFSFRAMPTGSPTDFAWRYYHPPGPWAGMSWWNNGGNGSGNSGTTEGSEGILRIRFHDRPNGQIEVSVSSPTIGSNSYIGDRGLIDLLRGRWDQVQVEQVGSAGTAVAGADQPLNLLRLSLSPALMTEYQARPSATAQPLRTPEFYRYSLDPKPKP